jgi:hypothetical protein
MPGFVLSMVVAGCWNLSLVVGVGVYDTLESSAEGSSSEGSVKEGLRSLRAALLTAGAVLSVLDFNWDVFVDSPFDSGMLTTGGGTSVDAGDGKGEDEGGPSTVIDNGARNWSKHSLGGR